MIFEVLMMVNIDFCLKGYGAMYVVTNISERPTSYSTQKLEAASSFETSVITYKGTWRHNT